MTLGTLLVQAAAVLAFIAFVAAVRWARGREASRATFRLAYHGMTATLAWAATLLMVAVLTHDFRFEYVLGYSSRDLPFLYLVSAFWAGQEGTYLLWALLAAGIGYFLWRKDSWQPGAVMACYLPTIGFQLVLMLNRGGNPFRLATQIPPDGRGLNLLLQDPWMATHPPMVFLGYAAATVPAVLALVALLRRDEDGWLAPALRWSLVSFVLLGIGIFVGGFWAYKVLGWGGYWGWDPVENASLVPWIVLTGLIHGILLQRKAGALRRTNLVLALSAYLLVLYGTFLTRSGLLADVSVHSFPAGSIYRFLVVILLLALGVSAYALARRKGPQGEPIRLHLSWPLVLPAAIGLFSASALFVLIGMSWPIVSFSSSAGRAFEMVGWSALRDSVVRPPWYNAVNLPLYVVLFGLLWVGPFLAWAVRPGRPVAVRLVPSFGVAAVGAGVAWALGARGTGSLLLFCMALAALTSNGIRLVKVARHRMLHTGASLAHLGFCLMFLGIVVSSAWSSSATVLLPVGKPVRVLDRVLTFQGHVQGSTPRHRWRLEVQRDGVTEEVVELSMFRYGPEEKIFRKPGILRSVAGDLYLAPQSLDVNDGGGRTLELRRGTPVPLEDASLTFVGFDRGSMASSGAGMTVRAQVQVEHAGKTEMSVLPLTMSEAGQLQGHPVELTMLPGVTLTLRRIAVEQGLLLVEADGVGGTPSQALTVEVSRKPGIGFLWGGTILLSLGCAVSVARGVVEERDAAPARRAAAARSLPLRVSKAPRGARAAGARRRVVR